MTTYRLVAVGPWSSTTGVPSPVVTTCRRWWMAIAGESYHRRHGGHRRHGADLRGGGRRALEVGPGRGRLLGGVVRPVPDARAGPRAGGRRPRGRRRAGEGRHRRQPRALAGL